MPNLCLSLPSSWIKTHLNVIFHVCALLPKWEETVKMWQFVVLKKPIKITRTGFFSSLTNEPMQMNYRPKCITPIMLFFFVYSIFQHFLQLLSNQHCPKRYSYKVQYLIHFRSDHLTLCRSYLELFFTSATKPCSRINMF